MSNLATALGFLDDLEQSEHYTKEAIKLQRRIGDRYGEVMNYNNLAWLYRDKNQLEAARKITARTLEEAQRYGFDLITASAFDDLGTIYLEMGRFEDAVPCLAQSARRYEKMKAHGFLHANYTALAKALAGMGEHKKAKEAARLAERWERDIVTVAQHI